VNRGSIAEDSKLWWESTSNALFFNPKSAIRNPKWENPQSEIRNG